MSLKAPIEYSAKLKEFGSLYQRTAAVVSHGFVVVGHRVHDILLRLSAVPQVRSIVVARIGNE